MQQVLMITVKYVLIVGHCEIDEIEVLVDISISNINKHS